MLEIVSLLMATKIPLGQHTTEVTEQVCNHVNAQNISELESLETPFSKRVRHDPNNNIVISFEKEVNYFSSQELRILINSKSTGSCRAYLFLHSL